MDRGAVMDEEGGERTRDPGLLVGNATMPAPGPNPLSGTGGDSEKRQQNHNSSTTGSPSSQRTQPAGKSANARPEREAKFSDYVRVFAYAKKGDLLLFVGAATASVGSGVTFPLMNVVFGKLIGNFNNYFTAAAQSEADFNRQLNRQSLYMLGLFIARFGLNYISKFCFRLIGIRMSAAIRLDYIRSLFAQTIHVLDSMPSGAAAATITATSNVLQLGISEKLGTFVEYTATIVAAIVIAFTYSWSLTLVTSSVILFIIIVLSILLPFIIRAQSRLSRAESRASSVAAEVFGDIRMVASCGAEPRMASRYREWVKRAKKAGHDMSPFISAQFGLIFFSLFGGFGLCFFYGTRLYADGTLASVSTVVIVLMSVMQLVFSLERISTPLIAVSKAMVAAAEFFTVIDAPRPRRGTLREPHVSATEDIVFRGVDFAYPARPSRKVLDGLDLRIEANKNTAIVGPSGSGKSTIVGLIEGWYMLQEQAIIAKAVKKDKAKERGGEAEGEEVVVAGGEKTAQTKRLGQHLWGWRKKEDEEGSSTGEADSGGAFNDLGSGLERGASADAGEREDAGPPVELKGSISVRGHELSEVDMKWWRRQIGLVQQEPLLFNESIFKNVSAGLVGSEWEAVSESEKRELVRQACVESFADEFIDRLPDRYDTQVGDQGAKLSGGQRQRIAIARSIVSKPKILILDEATSAIDVRGERVVQAALERASRGRTTITIAHRLSTVRNADRICVLQRGKVVEEGTHESLLARDGGVYAGLVRAQRLTLGDETEEGGDGGGILADEGEAEAEAEGATTPLKHEKSGKRSEESAPGVDQMSIGALPGASVLAALRQRNLFTGFGKLLREQKSRVPLYVLALIGAMGAAAAVPLQAYLFAKIVVVFLETGQQLRDDADFWSKMWAVLAGGVGASYFLTVIAATNVEYFISATYRQEYFESLLYHKTSYFDQEGNAAGQLTARLSSDPTALKELLGINMVMVLIGIFSLAGALAISFAYGWKLALVALCVTVPLGLVGGYYRLKYELQFTEMNDAVFRESSKFGAESVAAFRTVCSLVMEESICQRYEALLRGHVTTAYRKARWTTLIFAFADSMSLGCQALIFWYGGRLLSTREYDVTSFLVTYMAVIQGAESAGQWLSFGPNAAQASAAASRILQARDGRNRDAVSTAESVPDTDGGVRIELQDVCFRYPTRDMAVFRGLNLSIEKGQFAALVGASGSGKTSIVSLLERFYDVDGGRICFNGRDITEVNVYEYRKLLSLVAQEPSLFQGTLRENILLGVDKADWAGAEERMHQSCRDANIHDFIVSLPNGYDTNIGARGVSLSGGQRQRVSIARALMRDPKVLLLDEATSSLDSEAEKLVQAAFERVAKGRTTIAVAHRLATIQKADIIYVLGEGKVLEKGSHMELLRKKGVYWHMVRDPGTRPKN